ncbi:hypothetical protein EYF80_017626 [Liparis tanakae]|uniref:Uncharacterized protein n=1 Tax=Liparis tanakae TaxID=230148 RepID=A0A4Z2I2N6_9TELE|nr:hypothetical protein EYF80_017626 [Liparis tanakae]
MTGGGGGGDELISACGVSREGTTRKSPPTCHLLLPVEALMTIHQANHAHPCCWRPISPQQDTRLQTQPVSPPMVICVDGSKRGLTTSKTTLRGFLSNTGDPQRHRQGNRANIVCEVLLDVLDKVVRVFRVKIQHLVQPPEVNTLQVTVGQVRPDQVAFTCSERDVDVGQSKVSQHSITQTEKIFSVSVLADTLPKPTLVRLLRALASISILPIIYQMQAIQWASRANMDISSVRTTVLCCE